MVRVQLLTGGSWNNFITVQSHQRITTDRLVHMNAVSPEFFATLGARMIAGRDFDERDSRGTSEDGPRVAIVNEAFAKRYFEGRSPLGARLSQRTGPDATPDIEVVGVVANINYRGVREEWEQAYFPLISPERGHFYIRVQGNIGGTRCIRFEHSFARSNRRCQSPPCARWMSRSAGR